MYLHFEGIDLSSEIGNVFAIEINFDSE